MLNLCGGCLKPVKLLNEQGGVSRCTYMCEGPGVHGWLRAHTDDELLARDKHVIRAAFKAFDSWMFQPETPEQFDAIIAAADESWTCTKHRREAKHCPGSDECSPADRPCR